jgi:hypothetical protein
MPNIQCGSKKSARGLRIERVPLGDVLGLLRRHQAFGEELGEFLAEAFDLALIGQLPVASLLGKVAVVEGFDLRFYLVNPRIDQLHLTTDQRVRGDELGFQIGQRADAVVFAFCRGWSAGRRRGR